MEPRPVPREFQVFFQSLFKQVGSLETSLFKQESSLSNLQQQISSLTLNYIINKDVKEPHVAAPGWF